MVERVLFELGLLSFILSTFSSLITLKLTKKGKRNIIVKKDYLLISGGKRLYVYGIRLEEVDPLILRKGGLHILREYTTLLVSCCPNVSLEVRLKRKYVPKDKILKKLEREITALRVILEEDKSNKYLERKLKRLERMYDALQSGWLPSEIELDYLVISKDREEASKAIENLQDRLAAIFDTSFSRLSGRQILSTMLFKDTRKILTSSEILSLTFSVPRRAELNGIVLGFDSDTKEVIMINEEDMVHHIGIFGATGSGKSTSLATIIKRVTSLMELNVIVFDPKGDLISMVDDEEVQAYGPITGSSVKSRQEEVVNEFEKHVLTKLLRSERSDRLKTLIVIDEAWILPQELLEILLREGRSRGIGVIIATQSINDIRPQLLTNIKTMILMRHSPEDISDKLVSALGDYANELPYLKTGEAIVVKGFEIHKVIIDAELDVNEGNLKIQEINTRD